MFKLIEKRNPDPRFGAISFVWLTQLIHILLIMAVLKKIFNVTFPQFSEIYFYNKLCLMPFGIIWLVLFYRYFKKNTDKIEKSYSGKNILTFKNGVIVFSSVLVPLLIIIQLSKK